MASLVPHRRAPDLGGRGDGTGFSLAAPDAGAVDLAAQHRAKRPADQHAERARIARCQRIAKQSAADRAYDKARGAIVPAAVIAPVISAIDAVAIAEAAHAIIAPVAIIAVGVIAALARIGPGTVNAAPTPPRSEERRVGK